MIEDADPEDRRVHVSEIRHGYNLGKDLELTDGDQAVHRTVVDYGGTTIGPYLEFAKPLGKSFAAGETVVRYPEEYMHEILGESKRELERLGFEVSTLLAPYDNFDEWSMEFVPNYYDGVANARPGSRINDSDEFGPYETRRDYFIEFTSSEYVKQDLEKSRSGVLLALLARTRPKLKSTRMGFVTCCRGLLSAISKSSHFERQSISMRIE